MAESKHPDYYNQVLEDLGIEGIVCTMDPDSQHLIINFLGLIDEDDNIAEYLIPRLLHNLAVLWHKDKTLQYASDIITKSYRKNVNEPLQEGDTLG